MNGVYDIVKAFKKRYPLTICHRLRAHSKVVEKHLNPGETVSYAFAGQKNEKLFDIFDTAIVAVTNHRILVVQKKVFFGYSLNSITPDLYNDTKIKAGLLFGVIEIDTVKEKLVFSDLSKSALPEIETEISSFMIEAKQRYVEK